LKTKCDLISEKADYVAVFAPTVHLNTYVTYTMLAYLRFLVFIDSPDEDPMAFLHLAKDNEIKAEMEKIKGKSEELKNF
jgi:hypothetical protein